MAELTALDPQRHGGLRVRSDAASTLAARQHVINLRAGEIARASSDFPVFITRNPHTGDWALSAVCGFENGVNLFVRNGIWDALYVPSAVQTYPFYLMQDPDSEKGYAVGIDETNDAFCEDEGEALYDPQGRATPYLDARIRQLEADIRNDALTYRFLDRLAELGLINAIDLRVHRADDSIDTIRGLHSINEERLQALAPDMLSELNRNGYLLSLHAMLVSSFQLNSLIRRQSASGDSRAVTKVTMESSKEMGGA